MVIFTVPLDLVLRQNLGVAIRGFAISSGSLGFLCEF